MADDLLEAVNCGGIAEVQALLDGGTDANAANGSHFSALMMAAHGGNAPLVQLLLERGADPNRADMGRRNALMYAVMKKQAEIVRMLLEYGAAVDARDSFGRTALYLALSKRHHDTVQVLVEAGADCAHADSYRSALSVAMQHDCPLKTVRLLLDSQKDLDVANSPAGMSPLEVAVSWYQIRQPHAALKIINTLLERGADVNRSAGTSLLRIAIDRMKDYFRWESLSSGLEERHAAALRRRLAVSKQIIKLLLDHGARVGLAEALGLGDLEAAQRLLDAGADVNAEFSSPGHTLLMWAASKGDVDAVCFLIKNGADVNARAKYGQTALLLAQNYPSVVELLIQAGAKEIG